MPLGEETPDADKIGKKPPRSRRQKCRQQEPLVQEVNLILAAAVKLKALVRKQMHETLVLHVYAYYLQGLNMPELKILCWSLNR